MEIRISPSLLSADFARLGAEAQAMENAGADMLHIDVIGRAFRSEYPSMARWLCVPAQGELHVFRYATDVLGAAALH
jgi:hypothetical protein